MSVMERGGMQLANVQGLPACRWRSKKEARRAWRGLELMSEFGHAALSVLEAADQVMDSYHRDMGWLDWGNDQPRYSFVWASPWCKVPVYPGGGLGECRSRRGERQGGCPGGEDPTKQMCLPNRDEAME